MLVSYRLYKLLNNLKVNISFKQGKLNFLKSSLNISF